MTTEHLSADKVGRLEELARKASPGPWDAWDDGRGIWCPNAKIGGQTKIFDVRGWGYFTGQGHGALGLSEEDGIAAQKANADFVAASRLAVPALLSERAMLLAQVGALVDAVRAWEDAPDGVQEDFRAIDLMKAAADPVKAASTLLLEVETLRASAKAWEETAALAYRNEEFWRDLTRETGRILGGRVYVQDDGGIVDEPLGLRVPEVAKELKARAESAEARVTASREAVVRWMMKNSYATGHGDTIEDLLSQLDAEHKARVTALEGQQRTKGTVEVCEKCGKINPTGNCGGLDTELGHLSCPIKAARDGEKG